MRQYKLLFLALLCSTFSFAQIGINTTTIDASAALDIQYGTVPKGLLTPRMTTVQRTAITAPADGLIVYDTDLKSFYHYKTGSPGVWVRMNSEATGRTNFKRIKSTDVLATVLAAELVAGGNNKYLLNTNTLYEINGTVNFDKPIDLNNAYLQGIDSGDDKIMKATGNIFEGATGGTIKGLTITATAGNVFNLSGNAAQNLIFRDCIVANSASVGTINGFGLVFLSIVQFAGNTTGITYSTISQLLLSNLGWFGNNTGTFEKLVGTFGLVEKQGGFSAVNGTAVGFDVSSNPTITGDAVLESVVFTGANTTGYIKSYTIDTYIGYNFNNKWNIRSAGIPVETDAVAVGGVNLDSPYGTGVQTTLTTSTAVKIAGATVSNDFFRASSGGVDNRLKYLGNKKRFFTVNAATSFRGTAATNTIYVFYIALNGSPVQRSKTYIFTNNALDVVAVPIQSILELSPNDYVEVFAQRYSGTSDMLTVSLSLFMR
ncbi:hypothetical protein [Kaistella jeonii]|uniref:Cell wall anchor protein n=1 Tax=Kaistella jeonii TaxID=266749 RepID=A0A0C1F7I8_9FLAO|nr:hypothetical protein [Kaistella jeonii]KIA89137.1 hypothetical protein OA86_08740 [Kaistella jeonii]SFB93510.1 hypothetical protein SAMN05421876_1049 [Kaistella jeonii]VEI97046.1 Uncharacterised protein [Kaistella jeonii]